MQHKIFAQKMGYTPKENTSGVFSKKYTAHDGYIIEIDFEKGKFDFGHLIQYGSGAARNTANDENWVALECIDRLLDKGYSPKNISLEKIWPTGHGTSGRLDILVTRDNGTAYLMIECKTYGGEFDKAFNRINKDGGQLFTYFQQDKNAELLMLYASELNSSKEIQYRNEIIKIEEDYRQTANVKEFYDRWNKLTKNNGVFDFWVHTYDFQSKALTPKNLKEIQQDDSAFIFHQFLRILRHNVVSDKPNAFNKIFTLFLCKVYDEKITKKNEELGFQWKEGADDNITFQKRLTDLYKKGMKEFLDKDVTDLSDADFEAKYQGLDKATRQKLSEEFTKIRLKKNNEFAIKEVFDDASFEENAKVVKEVVELLQGFKIRYTKKHQYLSDFFELLLTTGLKQESGQFFTPVPLAQFIIKSMPLKKIVADKLDKGEVQDLLPAIIDYAAGSGHFITESMHAVQQIIDTTDPDTYTETTAKKIRNWKTDHFDWAFQYVYGIEKDYRLVKVGKVGCYLHGDGLAQIIHSDGLGNFKKTNEYKALLSKVDADFPLDNKQFDVVVSNPPYAIPAFRNNARKYYTESDFEIYDELTDQSSEIECLFIERTKQLLKDGGIAGVILPSTILTNTGVYTKARQIILEYFDLVGVVELGGSTFMATQANTVILFLRKRSNYLRVNVRASVQSSIASVKDVTINGIEKPMAKYVAKVWEGLTFDDYKSLLKKQPNQTVREHDIYRSYTEKIAKKSAPEVLDKIIQIEQEKFFYFTLTYGQKMVLAKSGKKKEEKKFLGYEFSDRRGSEGIRPVQKGKSIDECTMLFDADTFDNPEKVSTYILQAFEGNYGTAIHQTLAKNVTRLNLVDMLTFDRAGFEMQINLNASSAVRYSSIYDLSMLGGEAKFQSGLWTGEKPPLERTKVLRNTNFKSNNGRLDYTDVAEIDVETKQLNSRRLTYGDIILEKSGGSDTQAIGRVVLFEKPDDETFSFSNFCARIRVNDTSKLKPLYLWIILNDFYNQGGTTPLQNGVRLLNIDLEGYKKIKIPIPPGNVQELIIKEIGALEAQGASIAAQSDRLRELLITKL